MKTLISALALACAFSFASTARAGDATPKLTTDFGMSAAVGGGVSNFVDGAAIANASTGGNWTARFTLGTRTYVGAELAYLGSAQGIKALGVDSNAFLLSHGVEAALRVNALTGNLQPYLTAGLGWRWYSVQNTAFNTSDVSNNDNVMEIPIGVGLAYRYQGFLIDGRIDLRPTPFSTLMGSTNLLNWNVGAKLGWEF